jgi:positive regulator of sigma E activity
MRDEGLVKKIEGPYAEVLVQPREACHSCAARALCTVKESGQTLLRVLNPLAAKPGDLVEIEVPETTYSRQLIFIFGLLILVSLAGAILGTVLSTSLGLPASLAGVLGFFLGAGLASIIISKIFRRPKNCVFPVIRAILNENGGIYG